MRGSVCLVRLSMLLALAGTLGDGSAFAAGRAEHVGTALPTMATSKSAAAAPVQRGPIFVSQITAPSTLPGLGSEMAKTLRSVLTEAGLDARLATLGASKAGDAESLLAGRIEEAGSGRLRLLLQWRGHSAQALGDVEHLDDLAYAALEPLRSRLLADAGPTSASDGAHAQRGSAPQPAPAPAMPSPADPSSSVAATKPAPGSASVEARKRPPTRPSAIPIATSPPPSPAVGPAVIVAVPGKDKTKPPEPSPAPPADSPSASSPAASPTPVTPASSADPPATARTIPRPRIAVHIVGEPLSSVPPAFAGAGGAAQQTMVAYLQHRLRYPAVSSRLTGLVGGLDALTQSLRLGARHTLMARFDTLVDGFGPFGARTISGRLHVVLLLDGRPLLDRSLSIPPSTYYPTEPSTQVIARIVTAALDAIAGELSARLGAQLPPAP